MNTLGIGIAEPRAGIDLAVECVDVIDAAYLSAELGRRVDLR
jgi:hypothetical protein